MMSDEGKTPNDDAPPAAGFTDPVSGDEVSPQTSDQKPTGWLPPAPDPEQSTSSQDEYGGWLPPTAGPHIEFTPSARITPAQRDYAGWWSRVGANVLDSFIVAIPILILGVIVYFAVIGDSLTWSDDLTEVDGSLDAGQIVLVAIAGLVAAIYGIGYAPFLMARSNGQTIGKKVAKIRVVRVDGQPIGFWFAAAREFGVKGLAMGIAGQVSFGIASLLNYLWPLWDKENRAVHDLIMKTLVVKAPDELPVKASAKL